LGETYFTTATPLTLRLSVSPPFFRRLTRKLYNKCIAAQRILIEKLIRNYYENKEVGCILAVRPNVVWKVNLEEFLNKEEVIYKLIVDRVNKDDTDFLRMTFPLLRFDYLHKRRHIRQRAPIHTQLLRE
jgi:hypothetical protein